MNDLFPTLLAQEAAPLLERINPSDIIPIIGVSLGIGGGVIIALTAIIVGNWRKARDRRLVASLIQDMLDRNMTAAEIEQVMTSMQAASEGEVCIQHGRRVPPLPAKTIKSA